MRKRENQSNTFVLDGLYTTKKGIIRTRKEPQSPKTDKWYITTPKQKKYVNASGFEK
jgi:hypothetical protein